MIQITFFIGFEWVAEKMVIQRYESLFFYGVLSLSVICLLYLVEVIDVG
jgi:hypothetical protein